MRSVDQLERDRKLLGDAGIAKTVTHQKACARVRTPCDCPLPTMEVAPGVCMPCHNDRCAKVTAVCNCTPFVVET